MKQELWQEAVNTRNIQCTTKTQGKQEGLKG